MKMKEGKLLITLIASAVLGFAGCGTKEIELIPGPPGSNGHSLTSLISDIAAGTQCPTGGKSLDIYLDLDDSLSTTVSDKYQGSLFTCNGLNGLAGADGTPGVKGETGATGPQGPQGETGATGPQGEVGPQGLQGEQGPVGPAGSPGAPGASGAPGQDGKDGAPGASGNPGQDGAPGQDGKDEEDGEDGEDGAPGTTGSVTQYSSESCTSIAGTTYFYKKSGSKAGIYPDDECDNNDKVALLDDGGSLWVGSTYLAVGYASGSLRVINFKE